MILSNGTSTKSANYGKYDCEMAQFLYESVLLNGDEGDDECSDGEGNWAIRYGRRILIGDDRGFVDCETHDTEADAVEHWAKAMEVMESDY